AVFTSGSQSLSLDGCANKERSRRLSRFFRRAWRMPSRTVLRTVFRSQASIRLLPFLTYLVERRAARTCRQCFAGPRETFAVYFAPAAGTWSLLSTGRSQPREQGFPQFSGQF